MTIKTRVIVLAVVALLIIAFYVGLYIYINHLNNKIASLNVVIANQNNEIEDLNGRIETLNCSIDTLEKDIESFRSTLNITSDYVKKVEKTLSDEDVLKQAIYEETISNEEVRDWFSEKLPNDLFDLLNTSSINGMCNN